MQTIHLQLNEDQAQELQDLSSAFLTELEKQKFPQPASLSQLKTALKTCLEEQAGFAELWQQAQTKVTTLCLSHQSTAIRNLPWQIATEERELLTIAKSPQAIVPTHQPSLGYPLKVLVMVAAPEGVTRLAYEEEELQLLQAFSPLISQGLAEVHFTDDGSLENLQEKLEENRYHILHYSGHGTYQEGKGYLALEDALTGKTALTSAQNFNAVLAKVARKGHRPELIVLSACQTAQGVSGTDLTGIADTLCEGEAPAVVAMSASILDTAATYFSAHLYRELSDGYPLPDAFQDARRGLRKFELDTFEPALHGLAPGQWLIPQLLLANQVESLIDPKSPKDTLNFKQAADIVGGKQQLVELRVRPKNYVFIGRRGEKRTAFRQLIEGKSVLLRGQGGVGKTALAEHLSVRLVARNPRTWVFTHSEKAPAAQALVDQLKNYLTKEHKDLSVLGELVRKEKQVDQFVYLLQKAAEHCDPVFLFDNIESFQYYNEKEGAWLWKLDEYEDVLQLMQILDQHTPFPMIITGRYPVAEFPERTVCDLNTAPFSDFLRKCYQLKFSELAGRLKTGAVKNAVGEPLPSFEEIVHLLHQTFGGNYRALEFFDELYQEKGDTILVTLRKLAELKDEEATQDIEEGVLLRMSENLVFTDLLALLSQDEKEVLHLLSYFSIPVLPMAVGWQRGGENPGAALQKLTQLTLIENQRTSSRESHFYVTPLVKDLLKLNPAVDIGFDHELAGDYHDYLVQQDLSENELVEYSEAFNHYALAGAIKPTNRVGFRLCDFYYKTQQFRLSLAYGLRTEEVAGEATYGRIWNNLGLIYKLFGRLDLALPYYEKSLRDDRNRNDRQGEGTTLNNISQIYDAKGDYDRALSYLEKSLQIRQEIGDRQGEGTTLNNISQIHKVKGDYDRALSYLEKSLQIQQEIGDRQGEGTTLNNISQIYDAKGDYDRALSYLEKSLQIQQEIGDRKGEGTTLNNISQIHKVKGDYDRALSYLEKSLQIRQEIGDRKGESTTLGNIASLLRAQGKVEEAMPYFYKDLEICQSIGDYPGMAITLGNLGSLFYQQENYHEAIKFLIQAYQIYGQIKLTQDQENIGGYLGAIIEKIGEEEFKAIIDQLQSE